MTLDPQCQAILDAVAAAPDRSPFNARDAKEARRRYEVSTPVYAPETAPLDAVKDGILPGPGGDLGYRLYRPAGVGDGPLPILIFYHGGGWVFGNLESHDHVCRALAHEAGCVVFSVDYRLAPEHAYPAAVEDCLAATRWAAENAAAIGGDPARIAVSGDSAGGNLAAVISQYARECGPSIALQLLIYPAVDFTADTASIRENGTGFLLTHEAMEFCADTYLGSKDNRTDPRASPALNGDLSGLPPAYIVTAGYDPLRDEATEYANALRAAGIPVEHVNYDGMLHGFMRMGGIVDKANVAIGEAAAALRKAFK